MVCGCGHSGFRNHFGDGNPQRNVHWNGQSIFWKYDVDFKFINKIIEMILEPLCNLSNLPCK